MSNQPRQPKGTPVGGQFTGKTNPECEVHLASAPLEQERQELPESELKWEKSQLELSQSQLKDARQKLTLEKERRLIAQFQLAKAKQELNAAKEEIDQLHAEIERYDFSAREMGY
ncbi:MAG: hypothetical protein ACYDEP_02865 [Acidimicrobiales bacterium]